MAEKVLMGGKDAKLSRLAALVLVIGLLASCGTLHRGCGQDVPAVRACGDSDTRHCTVITVSQGGQVFFGG
jgi:predicted small secreted protein